MTRPHMSETSAEFARALGGVVVNFAALEESLRDAILFQVRSECGWDEECDLKSVGILTAGMPFLALVDKFGVLCDEVETARPDAGDPKKFCELVDQLRIERNDVFHSTWGLPTPYGEVRRFKRTARRKSGFKLNVTDTDVDKIWDLVSRLSEASRKVWEFVP